MRCTSIEKGSLFRDVHLWTLAKDRPEPIKYLTVFGFLPPARSLHHFNILGTPFVVRILLVITIFCFPSILDEGRVAQQVMSHIKPSQSI